MGRTELPQMHDVKSTNILRVGHHGDSLYVQFHPSNRDRTGATWRYWPLDASHFDALRGADSPGRYFIANIKSNPAVRAEKVG